MSSTTKFQFECNDFVTDGLMNRLEVEVTVSAQYEDEANIEDIFIWDRSAEVERPLETFSEKTQAVLEEKCWNAAQDIAHEVYYESQIARAEAYFEADR